VQSVPDLQTMRAKWIILFLAFFGCADAFAQPKRVLFLCDPVHQVLVAEAATEHKGQMQLEVPKGLVAYHSGAVLAQLDEILGDKKWDVIYFNFSIADLTHRDPNIKETRLMNKDAGGKPTSLEAYTKNLDQIVQRLKKTGAKLVWGNTMPMITINFFPTYVGTLFIANSELEYNQKAAEVMQRHGVAVVDLHGYIMSNYNKDEKHPPYSDYSKAMKTKNKPLHVPLTEVLLK